MVDDLIPLQQPDPPALMTRDTPTFTRLVGNKSQCVRRFRNIILRPSRVHRFCKRTMSYHRRVFFPCRSNWPIVRALKLLKKWKLSVCSTRISKCIDVYTYHRILTKIPISELYSGYYLHCKHIGSKIIWKDCEYFWVPLLYYRINFLIKCLQNSSGKIKISFES